jgi:hypothetical protein
MPTFAGVVWGRPLTWGTATSLHTAFVIKTGDGELFVKCDFLCYVRWGDDVKVNGSFRTRARRITDFKIEGEYFHATSVENSGLELTFEHP